MLGDKLGEEHGKVTGRRVLPSDGQGPRVETSFQGMGQLLGVDQIDIGTYWTVVRPDGTLYGEGQGVIMGSLYFQSASPTWSRLNGLVVVYENEVDADGNMHIESWEWK